MTAFDLLALLVLLISTLIGYGRGVVREVVALTALLFAAVAAVVVLPLSVGIFSHVIHARWLAATAGLVLIFVIAYLAVRMIGSAATARLHQGGLSGVDRSFGAGFGFVRALIGLGVLSLLLEAAPWPGARPAWLRNSFAYPLARQSGRIVAALAPRGRAVAGGLSRFMQVGVGKAFADQHASETETTETANTDDASASPTAAPPGQIRVAKHHHRRRSVAESDEPQERVR